MKTYILEVSQAQDAFLLSAWELTDLYNNA